jgi:hypothetical protein
MGLAFGYFNERVELYFKKNKKFNEMTYKSTSATPV